MVVVLLLITKVVVPPLLPLTPPPPSSSLLYRLSVRAEVVPRVGQHALIRIGDGNGKVMGVGVIALDACRRETEDGKVRRGEEGGERRKGGGGE